MKMSQDSTPYETTITNEYLIIPKVKERKLTWKDNYDPSLDHNKIINSITNN